MKNTDQFEKLEYLKKEEVTKKNALKCVNIYDGFVGLDGYIVTAVFHVILYIFGLQCCFLDFFILINKFIKFFDILS